MHLLTEPSDPICDFDQAHRPIQGFVALIERLASAVGSRAVLVRVGSSFARSRESNLDRRWGALCNVDFARYHELAARAAQATLGLASLDLFSTAYAWLDHRMHPEQGRDPYALAVQNVSAQCKLHMERHCTCHDRPSFRLIEFPPCRVATQLVMMAVLAAP